MNKETAFAEINRLQDKYVTELVRLIKSPEYSMMKEINFTSATGTGKTKMMARCITYGAVINHFIPLLINSRYPQILLLDARPLFLRFQLAMGMRIG